MIALKGSAYTHYTIPPTLSKSPGVVDYHVWIGRLVDLPALHGANKPPKEQMLPAFLHCWCKKEVHNNKSIQLIISLYRSVRN